MVFSNWIFCPFSKTSSVAVSGVNTEACQRAKVGAHAVERGDRLRVTLWLLWLALGRRRWTVRRPGPFPWYEPFAPAACDVAPVDAFGSLGPFCAVATRRDSDRHDLARW